MENINSGVGGKTVKEFLQSNGLVSLGKEVQKAAVSGKLTKEQVHEAMMTLPESWRYYWCNAGPCGCMGGANCSGMIGSKGVTYEDWQIWLMDNPKPEQPSIHQQLMDYFAKGGSLS